MQDLPERLTDMVDKYRDKGFRIIELDVTQPSVETDPVDGYRCFVDGDKATITVTLTNDQALLRGGQ